MTTIIATEFRLFNKQKRATSNLKPLNDNLSELSFD